MSLTVRMSLGEGGVYQTAGTKGCIAGLNGISLDASFIS